MGKQTVLIGTRKGAWTLTANSDRSAWELSGPSHLGSVVYHYVADPRQHDHQLMSVGGGHLGPSIMLSKDDGASWQEAGSPPAFAADSGRTVDHVFWLTPGHADEPDVWYAGTSPQGLFRSSDGGRNWHEVIGLNSHPNFSEWRGGDKDGTPDGPKLHSIIVDPADKRHLLIGMSSGGIFESHDAGDSWLPFNKGVATDFYPPKEDGSEYEFGHDPHCVVMHPLASHRLYHQNHCGLYRLDREQGDIWQRIGKNLPVQVGDIGFPIIVHPRDPDTLWVFPMDGSGLWPRTSPDGKPAVYCSRDGGHRWQRQDAGFPQQQAWWTVKRQCMAVDAKDPAGLYLGTTNGQLWASFNEGENWQGLAMDLPQIYSVEVVSQS